METAPPRLLDQRYGRAAGDSGAFPTNCKPYKYPNPERQRRRWKTRRGNARRNALFPSSAGTPVNRGVQRGALPVQTGRSLPGLRRERSPLARLWVLSPRGESTSPKAVPKQHIQIKTPSTAMKGVFFTRIQGTVYYRGARSPRRASFTPASSREAVNQ